MRPLLVLRPLPAAERTAARARAAGFEVVVAPLFALAPHAWDAPDPAAFDALMLTSANAVRLAGPALARYHALPVYAVGQATAAEAARAGFAHVRAGNADAAALLATMHRDGVGHALHLAGREHRVPPDLPFAIERRIVYAADALAALPAAAATALDRAAVALLHSPRAAVTLSRLLAEARCDPAAISVAAISPAAAIGRWADVAIAATPDDSALLAAAATLCGAALPAVP